MLEARPKSVGDAAHAVAASSGQGVSMAAEDGVILAKCLRDLPDTAAALAPHEKLCRDRGAGWSAMTA